MRILQILASRLEAPLCLAILLFCTASLQAQPTLVDSADTARSLQRADVALTRDKLRNKFNAFDYTDELPPDLGFGEFEHSLEQHPTGDSNSGNRFCITNLWVKYQRLALLYRRAEFRKRCCEIW